MSVGMFQTVKPMLLSSMLLPKLLDCPMQSVEMELMKVAQSQKEEIKGLETIEYQLKIFDDIPYEDQIKELVRGAKDNLTFDRALIKSMLEVYKSEDITRMLLMMQEDETSVMNDHQEIMLDTRNKNWIPEIGKYAKEQPTFFAVGSAHLAGENGVIKLLRKQGYLVKPVMK